MSTLNSTSPTQTTSLPQAGSANVTYSDNTYEEVDIMEPTDTDTANETDTDTNTETGADADKPIGPQIIPGG